jgi:hypothetical protein
MGTEFDRLVMAMAFTKTCSLREASSASPTFPLENNDAKMVMGGECHGKSNGTVIKDAVPESSPLSEESFEEQLENGNFPCSTTTTNILSGAR